MEKDGKNIKKVIGIVKFQKNNILMNYLEYQKTNNRGGNYFNYLWSFSNSFIVWNKMQREFSLADEN